MDQWKIEAINYQRQLTGEIIAGMLYDGIELTDAEHVFVRKCHRTMRVIGAGALSALKKINKRRRKNV